MIFYADILVVDDSPEHIALVTSILRSEGYHVCVATSGKATRAFFNKKLPDLVLLDIQMGDTSGFDVCREIKQSERAKDVPIIFMTAESGSHTITECFELGASDYIRKPFVKAEFLARVRTQLRASVQKKEFVAAYEELSQFSSCVSHDLRSPFTLISGMIGLLDDRLNEHFENDVPEDIQEITSVIKNSTYKVGRQIERIFDFSKMCNVRPYAEQIDTEAITKEAYEDLIALESPDRDVDFKCENLPVIIADERLFRMVMQNLLINALKYSSRRQHTVIRVYSVPNPLYYVIKVKDNGAGFDMKYVNKIFEMFQRLHTDEEFPGTGVGLAMVNRVMMRHRGKIEAYGEVDKGAEMTIYFPKNVKPIHE